MVPRKRNVESSDNSGDLPRRRSQRIKTIASQRAFTFRSRTPYLPPEIISLVAGYLDKADLKILRLVSKAWYGAVTPQLFDRVFVSPRTVDLDVFEKITSNPFLAASVKGLIYDVSTFFRDTQASYLNTFCSLTGILLDRYNHNPQVFRPPRQVRRMVDAYRRQDPYLYPKFGNDAIVTSSYAKWQKLAEEESKHLNGPFQASLMQGLSKLSNLRDVIMDDNMWGQAFRLLPPPEYSHGTVSSFTSPLQGSPLLRQWKPFQPLPAVVASDDKMSKSDHFKTLVDALFQSKRNVKMFQFLPLSGEGLSHDKVLTHCYESKEYPSRIMSCFWSLEILDLKITPWGLHGTPGARSNPVLGFLPVLLSRMTGLKRLFLDLTSAEDHINPPSLFDRVEACFTYDDVFLRTGKWPCLTVLQLTGIAMRYKDLVYLIHHQIHEHAWLELNSITLLDGDPYDVSDIFEGKPFNSIHFGDTHTRYNSGQELPFIDVDYR